MSSTRFTAAVHILTCLASASNWQLDSYSLALFIREDPGVTRRLIGRLRRAGLVHTRSGPGGGVRLALPPDRLDLSRIYRAAMPPGPAVRFHRDNPNCQVGRHLRDVLAPIIAEIETAFFASLEAVTIAQIHGRVRIVVLEEQRRLRAIRFPARTPPRPLPAWLPVRAPAPAPAPEGAAPS